MDEGSKIRVIVVRNVKSPRGIAERKFDQEPRAVMLGS